MALFKDSCQFFLAFFSGQVMIILPLIPREIRFNGTKSWMGDDIFSLQFPNNVSVLKRTEYFQAYWIKEIC